MSGRIAADRVPRQPIPLPANSKPGCQPVAGVAGVGEDRLMISTDDYLYFVDQALDGMTGILTQLGDDRAGRTPGLPATNSPYGIVTHCLGVLEYWAGYLVAGRTIQRDRDAEFTATGPVADLTDRVRAARGQLRADLAELRPFDPPRGTPNPADADLPIARTRGGVLLHIYEELAQHLGQLELTRDVLLAQN
jgi:hypothetical protein